MQYIQLVETYKKLESTAKRLEKTFLISEFLKQTSLEDLHVVTLLLQGKLFPDWDERKIGIASRLIIKAINTATGISLEGVEGEWKKTGDLGIVAENLVKAKKQVTLQTSELTVKKVYDNLCKLADLSGLGTVDKKMQLIAELLTSAKPIEAKYIVRTMLEELRVGVGEGSLRDAVVWAFFSDKINLKYKLEEKDIVVEDRENYNKYVDAVQQAYNLTNDFSVVAERAKTKGLAGLTDTEIIIGRPIKVMLAIKVDDVDDGFDRVGKPAEIEFKLDGFRMQIHKKDDEIKIFTRRLENVTHQFPEVVNYVKNNIDAQSFIIDSEAVGYNNKTGKYMPFQKISQRIRRKYDIKKLSVELPVELNIFDIIYYNGKNLISEPFKKRQLILKKVINEIPKKIVIVKSIVTSEKKDVEKMFKESIEDGNEGLMLKNLDAPYKPGARVGHMVKLKSEQEGLDLVIVGAEWGEGKRSKWLSSYTVACIDENNNFLEVGKVSTGLKEKEEEGVSFSQMTETLKPLIILEKGKEVKVRPDIVIEVIYEEVQKSPTYASGYALRFPRFKNLRVDRRPDEITTLEEIENLYFGQRKK